MKLRLLTIFMTVFLSASVLPAQEFSIRSIEAAIDDSLYSLAEQQIWAALSSAQPVATESHLNILLIRTLIGEERFEDAIIVADEAVDLPHQDAFSYWRARAYFDQKEYSRVFEALDRSKKKLSKGSYAAPAIRLRGRSHIALGDDLAAEESFAYFEKKFSKHKDAAQNLYDLASIQLKLGHKKSAAKSMKTLLKRYSDTKLANSVRLLLARELIATGERSGRKSAIELLTELGSTPTAGPRLRIAAWVELAALEQSLNHLSSAAEALVQAETLTGETVLRVRQKAARANLLVDEGKADEALELFDAAMSAAPDDDLAADILLQKAEALLRLKQYKLAGDAFHAYLSVSTDPEGTLRALTGKGWSLWEQERFIEAAVSFQKAAGQPQETDLRVPLLMKAGDAYLAGEQPRLAEENYRRVFEEYSQHALAPQAMYQAADSFIAANEIDDAIQLLRRIETDYPESDLCSKAALKVAEELNQKNDPDAALLEYQRIATHHADGAIRATALLQQGLLLYQIDRFGAALELFRTVTDSYPDAPEFEQALYMQALCSYYLPDQIEVALKIGRDFVEKLPASTWTPDMLFWLGEHSYNSGNYTNAQHIFSQIPEQFPQHELADNALMWAGNALFSNDNLLEAFELYGRLTKEYPNSDQLLPARFAQGEVLSKLGEFPRAILAYQEVIKLAPNDPLAIRAQGRLGDCLFTLGATDTSRYQEAVETYQTLYKNAETPFDLKLQTLYKIARCEEKLDQTERAFLHYMKTVYEATEHNSPLSPEAELWLTRAALKAAASKEKQALWPDAVKIYERIIQVGAPAQEEAAKLINRIKLEHPEKF